MQICTPDGRILTVARSGHAWTVSLQTSRVGWVRRRGMNAEETLAQVTGADPLDPWVVEVVAELEWREANAVATSSSG